MPKLERLSLRLKQTICHRRKRSSPQKKIVSILVDLCLSQRVTLRRLAVRSHMLWLGNLLHSCHQ
jgi:hypothetical protein